MRKIKITNSPQPKQNPLDLIGQHHIDKYGWSGSCIKAHRIVCNIQRHHLARLLGIREDTLSRYEDGKKTVGIKLSKELASIFKTQDWRVFRKDPRQEEDAINESYETD